MEKRLLTIGVMAERLHIPIHRAQYLVASRRIRPVERAGNLRVFDEAALDMLREEIRKAKKRKRLRTKTFEEK